MTSKDTSKLKVNEEDFVSVIKRVHKKSDGSEDSAQLLCYFFCKQISEEQFKALERAQLDAEEWGKVNDFIIFSY